MAAEKDDRAPVDAQIVALSRLTAHLKVMAEYLDAQLLFHRAEREPDRKQRAQMFP